MQWVANVFAQQVYLRQTKYLNFHVGTFQSHISHQQKINTFIFIKWNVDVNTFKNWELILVQKFKIWYQYSLLETIQKKYEVYIYIYIYI